MRLFIRLLAAAFIFTSVASSSFAAPARELDRNIGRILAAMRSDSKVTLRDVPLGRESLDTLEIEPMEVWAKDAKILAYGPTGEAVEIAPPNVKYFKGRVKGEAESAVFFSRSANGVIRGMVLIGDRKWTIGTGVRQSDRPIADVRKEFETGASDPTAPLIISELDEIDHLLDPTKAWQCDVGTHAPETPIVNLSHLRAEAMGKLPASEAGDVAGASYQMRIAVETDNELCAGFANNATALNTYIGDLVAKASIVYERDLNTTLSIGHVNLRNGGADPWTTTTAGGTGPALAEFGTYWHNNYPQASFPRSSAIFLSGRNFSGGVAWVGMLCDNDFYCGDTGANCNGGNPSATYAGQYAGGYAFNGSSGGVSTSTPDPTLTVNGIEFGLPGSNYWMLLQVMHELGHNVASPHSSCVGLTAEEKTLYNVTRDHVDRCLIGGGASCWPGPGIFIPTERGTIMSYCHNYDVGGFPASRYIFGKAGEPSEKMFPIFRAGFEAATPNPTVTIQAQPVSCAAGRTASVATCSGCTYAWEIEGGTITSSTTTSSITYTPTDPDVTLTVTVLTARGCGITASREFTSSCVGVLPPTNVVATATSTSNVNVTWTASAGAASYNVYRSIGAGVFTLVGNTAALFLNDGGRSANTAYLYRVRAVSGAESADSNTDLATTVIFANDPLTGGTAIQATHITQLRTAINAVRTLAAVGAGSYTDPTLTVDVTKVKTEHITDLRSAIDEARELLALSALSYGDTITSSTAIEASHLTELRNGVK